MSALTFSLSAQEQQGNKRGREAAHKHMRNGENMNRKTPEEIAKLKTDRMDEKLKFTDEQREQVYAVHLDKLTKQREFQGEMRKMGKEKRLAMKESHEKIQELLTSEQKAALKEMPKLDEKGKFRRVDNPRRQGKEGMPKKHTIPKEKLGN